MPDRSAMKEYRQLDAKRAAEGLTPEEEARLGELRDLFGPESGAGGLGAGAGGGGFDVNAAAAQLRGSLGPAFPGAAPEAAALPFDPNAAYDPNVVGQYDPAAPADPAAQVPFDPSQPWDPSGAAAYDPNAPAYDPDAPAFDPNAAYDPNAAAYDPNAGAFDPDAAAYDPNAGAFDPNAPFDPGAAYDPNAAAYDPNAAPYDPNAGAFDPSAPLDPDAPYDPNAAAYDPNAAAYANAAPYDPDAPAYDPNAAAYDANAAGYDPNASYDPGAPPYAEPEQPEPFQAFGEDPAADVELIPAEPLDPDLDPAADPGVPPPEGEGDATLAPAGWDAEPPAPRAPPSGAPLGEYDELGLAPVAPDADLEAALPFDPGADSALPPGDVTAAYAAPLGEYDDTAGFGAPAYAAADVPADAPGLDVDAAAPSDEASPAPQDPRFRLESEGSFGGGGLAAAHPWESAPALDVEARGEPPGDATGFEIAPAPEAESFGDAAPRWAGGDLGGPELDAAATGGAGPAPELDFSRPDFSAEEAVLGEVVAAEDPSGAAALDTLEIDVAVVDPPAELSAADVPGGGFEIPAAAAEASDAPLEFDVETSDLVATAVDVQTIEGADVLEGIVPDGAPPPRSLDFEPLVPVAPPGAAAPPPPPVAAMPPPPPVAVAAPPPAPAPREASPPCVVAGAHRVVVHTLEGTVKRGVLEDADLAAATLALAPQPGAAREDVGTEKVKAIFFMLSPGEKAPVGEGRKVRVTFRDGRQVAGFSPDYSETGSGFFMIPADTRTNTGRIWVYRAAVRQVTVS